MSFLIIIEIKGILLIFYYKKNRGFYITIMIILNRDT